MANDEIRDSDGRFGDVSASASGDGRSDAGAPPVEAEDGLRGVPAEDQIIGPELDELIAAIDAETREAGTAGVPDLRAGHKATAGDRLLLFALGGAYFALPLDVVTELGDVPPTTTVPNVPDWVSGVGNLRGDVLTVLDLRPFLLTESEFDSPASRMIVVRSSKGLVAGLLVERVLGIVGRSSQEIKPATAPLDERLAPFLVAFFQHQERTVSLVELDRLLPVLAVGREADSELHLSRRAVN